MRVLLVSANRERIPDPIFPLGLAYIAAATRQAGHTVRVADLCFGRRPLKLLGSQVVDFKPEAIGLSLRNVDNAAYPLTVDYLSLHREVIDYLKTISDAPVVLGGSAFSIMPQAYMQVLNADWGIAGEGEKVFIELLAALQSGRQPAHLNGVIAPAAGPAMVWPASTEVKRLQTWGADLQPARDLFAYTRYIRRGGMGSVQTKRGCVFKCSYCTYPLLEGKQFRCRDPIDVVDEIETLQRDYGPHPLFFVDSILNFPRGHVEGICEELLRRGLEVRWSCYATPVQVGPRAGGFNGQGGLRRY